MKTTKQVIVTILSIFGGFLVISIIATIIIEASQGSEEPKATTTEYTGRVISLDTYMKGCLSGATAEDYETFTREQFSNYCRCTYNKGMALYGGEQLAKELDKLGSTKDLTPEFNTIVDECVAAHLL